MGRRLVASSRYLILVAVIGTFISAVLLVVIGAISTARVAVQAITTFDAPLESDLLFEFIELADLFLLSTVLYIISIGLYALFIDDQLPLPHWLQIHTLDDLKNSLTSVIIVVLGVLFLGQVVRQAEAVRLLQMGIGIGLVVAALSYFLGHKAQP